MRRVFKPFLVILAILSAGVQVVRPAWTSRPAGPADALTAYVPAHVGAILDRS